MPASFIWKPATTKGPVLLVPSEGPRPGTITIVGADGKEYVGRYLNTNEGRHQYVFEREIYGQKDLSVEYNGMEGTIANANQSYEGSGFDSWQPRAKGSLGSTPGGTGVPGGLQPGTDPTGNAFFPADLTGEFPSPVLANYEDIETAPYDFTDVREFAEEFGEFNRQELIKNNALARDFAFDALDTELKGLERFSPGAGALKRREISLDNQFNQMQRNRQIAETLPDARSDLEAQRKRANIYARGGIPDEVTDRGLELGIRSGQADRASSAGFGATSSVSRKAQDLMTAEQRYQIAQQGEQNLTSNLQTTANLALAPTQYSDAGAQIRTMPSLSGSQLQTSARGEISAFTGLSTPQALQTQVQQNQFTTGLEQNTRQFNASNTLQTEFFNVRNQNEFALQKFDYRANLAGAIAGSFQTGANTALQLEQQQAALDLFRETLAAGQKAKEINSILGGLLGVVAAAGGITGLLDSIRELVGEDEAGTGSDSSGPTPGPIPGPTSSPNSEPPSDRGPEPGPVPGPTSSPNSEPPAERDDEDVGSGDFNRDDIPNQPDPDIDFIPPGESPDSFEPIEFIARAARQAPTKALRAAGISETPGNGRVARGFDERGKQVYVDAALADNNDQSVGAKSIQGLIDILTPLDVLSDDKKSVLAKLKAVTDDTSFYATLADQYARGDKLGFVNTILNKFQRPTIDRLIPATGKGGKPTAGEFRDRAGLNAAVDAAQLFANWDRLGPAAKSKAIASIALDTADFAGTNLRDLPIIKPGAAGVGTPGMTVGQGLNLLSAGVDIYNLTQNWDQYNDLQRVAGTTASLSSIAGLAKDLGFFNTGTAGVANTPLLTGTSLGSSLGSQAASAAGSVKNVAVTELAGGTSVLGVAGGVAGIALGADQLRRSWGTGGKEGAVQGFLAGAAMASGIIALSGGAGAPIAAGVMATSVLGSVIKTGKEENQVARDRVRKQFKKVGLLDDNFSASLPDGHIADLGVDGKGGKHKAKDPSKILAGGRDLYSYDIDYTNDLDYISGMGGIALSRLVSGGPGKNVDQMGGQLGNQALGKVGFGKELTRSNFDQVMQNQRALYAQAGIKTKADAYGLTDQMMKEGRINGTQAVTMQQAFNMMYDRDGFDTAQRLMNGRWRGAEVAADKAKDRENKADKNFRPGVDPRQPEIGIPKGEEPTPVDVTRRPAGPNAFSRPGGVERPRLPSKADVVARNRTRYSSEQRA